MSDAKVEQRHLDTAKQFVHDYNVRDIFQSREGPKEDLAQHLANAEAAGYAAGVAAERATLIALRERALANLNDIEAQLAADRARSGASDAQEVKP
jgi:hypothetical protein